jgi:type IV secretory pathway VirB2 component (pilin)
MSLRWKTRLVAGTALALLPGTSFASGGQALPFNQAFDTVTGNLTGPTAKAIVISAFFAGIVGVMVSHDRPWMKNIGTVIAGGALLVGIPGILDTLGISAAEEGFDWRTGLLMMGGMVASVAVLLFFAARIVAGGPGSQEGEQGSSH